MALLRWQPFSEMETLRHQMDRMFDELAGANSQITQAWTPAVELQDTTESIILRAEIPGVAGKDLDVHVTREAVSIAGETRQESKQQEGRFFRSEFRYGKFQRIVNLPVPIQNDRVQAEFKHGILTLTLPKVEEVKKKVVKINLGESQGAAIAPAESSTTNDVWADSNS